MLVDAKVAVAPGPKAYPSGDRGLAATHKDPLNADLLAFIKG
jgi:hypothetical protein